MTEFFEIIKNAGTPGYIIMIMAAFALAIIVERAKVLYFDFSINSHKFMDNVKALVVKDNIEDAVTYCLKNDKKPLAHVVKAVLERSDRDDESIHQGMDIAMAEVIPKLGKRLGYLAMVANVATLVGLLGTIQGLIFSFDAISSADPSQKSEMLSKGISLAMNTTALGLSVAIPVMIIYAFLHARQGKLLEDIAEHSSKVVDLLTTRQYQQAMNSAPVNAPKPPKSA